MENSPILDATKNTLKIIKSDLIKKIVCNYYGMELNTLELKTRKFRIVIARKMCIAFIKKYIPQMTYESIGALFNQDHSTIVHAYRHFCGLIEVDREVKEDYNIMLQQVSAQIEALNSHDGNLNGYHFFDLDSVKAIALGKNQFVIFKGIPNDAIELIMKQNFPQANEIIEIVGSGVNILQKKV